jgi:glycosyltransferase involved in cell wall biosynthesis
MAPKVSVIVPCHDLGAFLDEAVASVHAQTMQDFEVVIVNDGSSDPATLAALERLDGGARPRTSVSRIPRGGVTRARNHGAARARGEYLMFLDADDRLRPTCLAETAARLDAEPALAFVSFWVHLFGDEEWDWRPESCELAALLGECTVATAALVRREAFERAGGFDPAMELGHEDWDLWLTLVERGFAGAIVPKVLFDYRRRAGSRSSLADGDAVYLELLRARARKHDASYRAGLEQLAWQKDAIAGATLRRLAEAPRALEPAVERRRAEVAALRARLDETLRRELTNARATLDAARADAGSLRASRSWRLTAPLRHAYEWLRARGAG